MENQIKNSILIVDDEKSNLLVLNDILSGDYTLFMARGGLEAVKRANEYIPDLILLDIIMPDTDGYAVLAELKKSEKTQGIPVIFITGLSDPEDEEKGLELGAVDYISKPFSPAIVKLRIKNHLKIINQTRQIIKNEIAVRSSRIRSEFLSRVSHEMRTPLNAIMGLTVIAQRTAKIDEKNDMLERVMESSTHLLKLVDDILDMSDIEDNKLRLSVYEFGFTAMMEEIIKKAAPDIREKNHSLLTVFDKEIPGRLIGDERRLARAVANLLSNAIKFTPKNGEIQINAFIEKIENETAALRIEVIDNGVGMSPEEQGKIFIPFEQADCGSDRKFGGAGLGLSISKYIAGLMGGGIRIESEPGKGTKVSFTAVLLLPRPEEDICNVNFSGKTALLAEDIETNREIVKALLSETGLHIECAESGKEALEMFSADPEKFDVILMDINMPEMDGLTAARLIRGMKAKEGASVPIIALSANVLASEVETYLEAGMNDHLGKPVNYNGLIKKLMNYL